MTGVNLNIHTYINGVLIVHHNRYFVYEPKFDKQIIYLKERLYELIHKAKYEIAFVKYDIHINEYVILVRLVLIV